MPSRPKRALAVVVLAVMACEVSTPPAPSAPPIPPAAHAALDAPNRDTPALDALPTTPPAPPEPPWTEAAGLAYREVVLGSDDPDARLPMIVAIHGLGDHPDNFRHLLDRFPEPVRIILPRGLDPVDAGGWSWFPIRARDPNVEALAEGIATAADRIAAGLRVIVRDHPTLGRPVVTGFSQGGMLTFTLAMHHPDVVGHAIAVSGWLPPPLWPATKEPNRRYPPLHALHGTSDAAVLYEPTVAAVEALASRGFSAELTSYEGVGHMIPPAMRRDLYDRLLDAVHDQRRRTP